MPVITGVHVASGIDLELTQGANQSVVVQADENLMEYILTRVENGVLRIYSEVNIMNTKSKVVKVTVKDINRLQASSAGDIEGKSVIKSDALRIDVSSAGDVEIAVDVRELNIEVSSAGDLDISGSADVMNAAVSSAGDLDAPELKVREANIEVSSSGDAEIYVTERLTAKSSSAGNVYYGGNPEYVDARSSSSGNIRKR